MVAEMVLANPPGRNKRGRFVKGSKASPSKGLAKSGRKTKYVSRKGSRSGGASTMARGFVLVPPIEMVGGIGAGVVGARAVTGMIGKSQAAETPDSFAEKMKYPTYQRAAVKAGIGVIGGGIAAKFVGRGFGLGFLAGAFTDALIDGYQANQAARQGSNIGEDDDDVVIVEGDGMGEDYIIEGDETPIAGDDDNRAYPSDIGDAQALVA